MVKELQFYFQTNGTPGSDLEIVWEAHKTVIRGVLFKHGARIRRDREAKLVTLLENIQKLQTHHKLLNRRRQVIYLLQYKDKAAIQSSRKL